MVESSDGIYLTDEAATAALGAALMRVLGPGDAVLMRGPIGAGKTCLARAAIADRLGRPEDIPSPTFTLVQVYEADAPIWHADLYRLGDEEEMIELGLDEAYGDAIVLIEWPEKLGSLTPERRLELTIEPMGDGRMATWRAIGGGWDRVVVALQGFAEAQPDAAVGANAGAEP